MDRCQHCTRQAELFATRGERVCVDCLWRNVAATGVDVHVTDVGSVDYVHNTARDRDKITVHARRR